VYAVVRVMMCLEKEKERKRMKNGC
jgi:hypothetical protein